MSETGGIATRRGVLRGAGGLALAAAAVPVAGVPARAAPAAEPWPRWEAHDPGSTRRLRHDAWGDFLARHRRIGGDAIARVAYGAVDAADRRSLEGYLDGLAGVPVSGLARPEQFAFWVNLYNALTVAVVLRHWPVDTIRDIDISPGLFADGPWGAEAVMVEGVALSLDDIEHRILRPVWRDPRVHYAVNCAALGCPDLAAVPFTAAETERLLAAGARAYVAHPRGSRVDGRGRLVVSSIYRWFREDFGGTEAGVIAHLRRHATAGKAERLATADGIAGDGYDWTINAPDRSLDLEA
ncbi:MAG: DUF547 domain-containing protein [Azospirillaceae bacterium]